MKLQNSSLNSILKSIWGGHFGERSNSVFRGRTEIEFHWIVCDFFCGSFRRLQCMFALSIYFQFYFDFSFCDRKSRGGGYVMACIVWWPNDASSSKLKNACKSIVSSFGKTVVRVGVHDTFDISIPLRQIEMKVLSRPIYVCGHSTFWRAISINWLCCGFDLFHEHFVNNN